MPSPEACGREIERMQDETIKRLRSVLHVIVDSYDSRSELFTSDADCAANLADHARLALGKERK